MALVKNIAIVGAGGNIGSNIAGALVQTGKYQVSAITRPDSKNVIPAGLNAIKTEYDHASLVAAMKGQDALIITMSVTAPPDNQLKLIDAAAEAKVRYVMPSEWGSDPERMPQVTKDMLIYDGTIAVRQHLKKVNIEWIGLACSFWYEFSLAGTEIRYGFDFESKTVTLFGDGNTKINTTTWPQVGRAVVAIMDDPERWRNRSVYVNSFYVSQRDMLASIERLSGEKWTVRNEAVEERYARGIKLLGEGNMQGFGVAMYTRGFYPDGALSFETDNQALGLLEEDFDQATNVGIEMSRRGENNAL